MRSNEGNKERHRYPAKPRLVCWACIEKYHTLSATEFDKLGSCPVCWAEPKQISEYAHWDSTHKAGARLELRRRISWGIGLAVYLPGMFIIMASGESLGWLWLPTLICFSFILAIGWVVGGRILDRSFALINPMHRCSRSPILGEIVSALMLAVSYWKYVLAYLLGLFLLGFFLRAA